MVRSFLVRVAFGVKRVKPHAIRLLQLIPSANATGAELVITHISGLSAQGGILAVKSHDAWY